jgi:hypothetical protein
MASFSFASGLSAFQKKVFMVNRRKGAHDWVLEELGDIAREHSIGFFLDPEALSQYLRRTALGLICIPRHQNGGERLHYNDDIARFLSVIDTRRNKSNSVTTQEAKNIVTELRRVRLSRAARC